MQVKIVLNYFQKRPENPNESILLLKEMEDLKNDIKPSQISQEKYEDQIKEQLQNMVDMVLQMMEQKSKVVFVCFNKELI